MPGTLRTLLYSSVSKVCVLTKWLAGSMAKATGASGSGQNVTVAVRVRPLSQSEIEAGFEPCCTTRGRDKVVITKKGLPGAVLRSQQEVSRPAPFLLAISSSEIRTGNKLPTTILMCPILT